MKQITGIKVYSSGSTELTEPELANAGGVTISTLYPGGIFGRATFTIPRKLTKPWGLLPAQRIKFYSGLQCVWEGRITGWGYALEPDTQSVTVNCLGYWADVLMVRGKPKPWAETSLEETVWRTITSSGSIKMEMYTEDRTARLRITPNGMAFVANDYYSIRYIPPTGQTVKRITFSFDFQEAAQDWGFKLRDTTNATDLWAVTASGTGTQDITLGTASSNIAFQMYSNATQTAPGDETIYGEVTSVTIYTETGSINLTEVAKDIRGYMSELSANEGLIGSNTYSLVPFVATTETYADLLSKAAGYGDSSFNAWACGVKESDLSTDDLPILFVEQQPALTDYDYSIRLDDYQLESAQFEQDVATVENYISYEYTEESGSVITRTPGNDANLKDTASIALYGERHAWLSINTTSATVATNFARRYLAAKKNLQWTASGGIPVKGSIRAKTGETIPVCQVRAGMRLRIENFLDDLSGTGLTFLITATEYDDETQTTVISVGRPDYLLTGMQARIDDGRKF